MDNPNTVIREAYRLAEQRLEWQFTSAMSADQRAMGVAGMLVAAGAILAALAESTNAPWLMLVGAGGLVVAALLAWYSARPVAFYAPGAEFENLKSDIDAQRPIEDVLTELGGFHDKHIRYNDRMMRTSNTLMKWAFRVALSSVTLTILGQLAQMIFIGTV